MKQIRTTVKVVLYTSKILKSGEHPVMVRITKDCRQRKIGLGISCPKDLWDLKSCRPKRKHLMYHEICATLQQAELEVKQLIFKLEEEGVEYSVDDVMARLTASQARHTVFSYIEDWEKRLKESRRVGYAETFRSLKNSLKAFHGRDLSFSQVNHTFLAKWEEYFMKKGVSPNAFFVYLRTFKTVINSARREEIVPQDYNPYKDISFSKFRRIQTKRRAISKAELQQLRDLKLPQNSPLLFAQHIFFFSYYCRGINFVDMANLKWSNLRNGRLYYTRKKTNEGFNMDLLEPALKILEHYRPATSQLPDNYIFPILTAFHTTEQQQKDRVRKILSQVNKNLKEIAKQAGVEADLTTYVARHTFATVLKQSGASIAHISELMGHDSEATTRIYLKGFENEELDEVAKLLL